MKVRVIGSTCVGYEMPKEEALNFGGKAAGICYMPDSYDAIQNEPHEKTMRRVEGNLTNRHHSVFEHAHYSFVLEGIPKILAMVLNNEGVYSTSEKSGRYTQLTPTPREQELYNKWLERFKTLICDEYGDRYLEYFGSEQKADSAILKIAQENARYITSVFTNTTMEHTLSFTQLNYLLAFFEKFISEAEDTDFNKKLKSAMHEFLEAMPEGLREERLNANEKERKISIFDDRESRREYFSETYCTTYKATFAQYAQAQRHRTLQYKMRFLDKAEFYVPEILRGHEELEKEWLQDMESVAHLYPNGMLVSVRERGTYESFILKCKERLCGCAQLEISIQTKETLDKYLAATKENGEDEIYAELSKYSRGARCTFPKFKCAKACIWGARDALNRKI